MKIKDGYLMREVAGSYIVVPVGEDTVSFNGVMTLAGSGAMLWRRLEEGAEREELLQLLLQTYDIDAATAGADLDAFLEKLVSADVLVP